ncbi:MAG: ThiF family adenylyltransferase [Myxococcales bacterium]|nr:ThiF family adenylyltransferase [Myxococcales bacterium]
MSAFLHERSHRGADAMARLRDARVVVCGSGALGSHLATSLARAGVGHLRLVDRDRVEERNLSTQPWTRADVGAPKAKLLAATLYRAVGTDAEAQAVELTDVNAKKLLRGVDLVIDAFDNTSSRACVQRTAAQLGLPCMHAGLSGDGYGEVVFDPGYRVPSAPGEDLCDYPLAGTFALLTATLAAELALRFLVVGEARGAAITFGDLVVRVG